MYTFIVILILIVCVLLALVVLTQVMGARQSADFIEKATWWLAGILVALCLAATISISMGGHGASDPMKTEVTNTSDYSPVQQATAPEAAPVAE